MKFLVATMALLLPALAHAGVEASVRSAVETEARRALPDSVVEVAVHSISTRGTVEVPADAELRVRVAGDEDWLGRIAGEIDVILDGRTLGTLTLTAEVAAYVEVPVSRGMVSRGATIARSDLALAKRDVSTLPRGVLLDADAVVGRVAKRDLSLNQLLRESDLDEHLDARRNQAVILVIARGSMRITAPGILRRDARIGDLVEVLSLGTKTTVHGVLTGPETVAVAGALPVALRGSR